MRTIIIRLRLFLCVFLFFIIRSAKAQVILSESFENPFPPTGWTIINAGTGNNWVQDIFQAKSGNNSMACFNNDNNAANAWAFTPALSLTAGNVYRISYWYKMNTTFGSSKFKITVGNNSTTTSQTTVVHDYPLVNNSTYLEGVDYYDATTSGNFNFAFNCYAAAGYYAYGLEIDSIVIKQMPKCSGIPVTGTATAVISSLCSGDTTIVKLNGNYNFYGLSFQWQSSPKGANSFTNITNATDTFVKVNPIYATDYRCIVSCSVSGLNNTSNIATVDIDPTCYCHLAPVDCQYGYIANVTFAGINNSSACSPQGFTYYSAVPSGIIYQGATMPASVTVSPGATKYIGIWIDFDRNGRYDSTEFTNLGGSSGGISGTIVIPGNAVLGATRMRVRERYYIPFTKFDACTSSSGADMAETEEYNLNIQPLVPCTITPVGGTTNSSAPTSICMLTNFTLSVTGSSTSGVAESYQWQSSLNNSTWTDIAGATSATLITQQSVATYYRRKIICNNSLFAYSTAYLQQLTPFGNCYCTPTPSSCGGITITNLQFGNINNTSGCGPYINYSTTIPAAPINAGSFVPLTVSFTSNAVFTGVAYVKAWIDFNQNGIFETAEAFNIASSGTNATSTFLVRIPYDAKAGITRMRVKVETGGFDQMDPCITRGSGETEDYGVNITASATPSRFFVVYVNKIASGANNGSSWADALTNLGTAYAIVKSSDTIKVAKGTYTPGYGLTDGVSYLGGYPNTGTPTDAERNFSVNQTILTGQEMFGYQLHNSTLINGFIIDSLSTSYGYLAAIRLENSDPVITNCVFRKNDYRVLYLYNSSPLISNCFFLNNTDTYLNKGQIQVLNNSNPKIINCVFNKNTSISIITSANNSAVKVANCTFSNNNILNLSSLSIFSQAEIAVTANSSANVSNCIFSDLWNGNNYLVYSKLTDSSNVSADNTSTANVTNSITSFNQAGTNLLRMVDPKFKDTSNAAGADNLYFTADDGFQLINPCSPAMNAGLNSQVEINTDILGNPRIVSTAVDMGAYEVQANPIPVPTTLYVNASATGNNNGTSWANAFTNLQTAFLYCSDTIKVAAGTYYPSTNDKLMFFALQNKRVFLGGYPNTGNPGDNLRNPTANPTILSGTLPSGNVKSDNIVQGSLVDSTAILNGFIIQDAQAGAVYLSYKASPVITSCVIKNNAATAASFVLKQSKPKFIKCTFGNNNGGITVNNSTPVIDSCSFIKNFGGSAIANNNRSLSIIKNSTFSGNNNVFSGGDIYNDNSDPQITNCFSDSAFAYYGGSIANVNNSNPVITKCVFTNAQTPYYASATGGGVCYNNNSKPVFLNCSFINAKAYGGAFYNVNSIVKIENGLGYGNAPANTRGTSFMLNNNSTATLINSTIVKSLGGVTTFTNDNNSTLNIKNSILWANNFNYTEDPYYGIFLNNYQTEVINTNASATNITNSITRIYGTTGVNGNLVAVDPRFININNPAGADGIFGTADDGLQLCSCSPAINAAINGAGTATTDIAGNPRVVNAVVDMGALEYQSAQTTSAKTSYVSASAAGVHDGTSWANAYNNLHQALNNPCADTIKVMQGVYKPALASRDSAFVIDRKVLVLGGYENTANPSEASRNADDFPTLLSGEIGNINDTADNSQVILKINNTDSTVKLDGLSFTHCFSNLMNGNVVINGGSIYSINNKNLQVKNCRFISNATKLTSSSLFSVASTLEVSNSVFAKNNSNSGPLIAGNIGNVLYATGAIVQNCVFENNQNLSGSTVYADGNFDFKNCIFYKNAALTGAGVYNTGVSIFSNCDFITNTSSPNGAGINNTANHRAYLLNCIFDGNYTGNGIYADWFDYNGAPGGSSQYNSDPRYFVIKRAVVQTSFPYEANVCNTGAEQFVNMANPAGPDHKWFTDDDGLKLLPCSPLIDKGAVVSSVVLESRPLVMPLTDILDSQRTVGAALDLGAYEYPGYYKPVVSITVTDSVICSGSSVTFTASPTGGGAAPVYQWQVNGVNAGTNSSTFITNTLNNNDKVRVILTSNDPCITTPLDTSNVITMSVSAAIIPSVNITTSTTSICQGTTTTFTATPANGGATPAYQWQVNGVNAGTNSNSFTTATLTNNAQVKVALTSSFACAVPATVNSNIITMTVSPLPVANAGNDVAVCAGASTQLNATGGTSYTWSPAAGLNNAAIANPIATPATTTSYIVTVSNSANCTAKDTVVVTVNPITNAPTVSISTAATSICAGTSATFTAAATNAGNNPGYQWSVNAVNTGNNSSSFTSAVLANNDQVKLVLTSNAICQLTNTATSNIITMNVQPQLAIPVITLNNRVFTVTNPDLLATYTWQINTNNTWVNVVPAATGITYTATAAGEYRVMVVKGACTNYSASQVTSFREPANNAFGIFLYPNPGNNFVKVDSIKLSQNWETLEVINTDGKLVLPAINIKNQTSVTINISALIKGTYFFQLRRKDGEFTSLKFVKL